MYPQLNLIHLKFFCDAVTHGSISESAKVNFVTQSTVSQAIIKLEKILNVELLVHTRQKFQVTEEGRILFEHARHIFKAVQDIHEKINQNQEVVTGAVKFVCTNSLGMSFIAPTYQKMQLDLPHVDLNMRLGNLSFIRSALRQKEAEFAVVVYDQNFSQFSKQTLKRGAFQLYQKRQAPLHLAEKGILIDSADGLYVSQLQEHFNASNLSDLKLGTELAGWEVVARFTDMGIGIGFFPDYILANDRYPNLQVYPAKLPSFDYEICAIYNKGEQLSRAAKAFVDRFAME